MIFRLAIAALALALIFPNSAFAHIGSLTVFYEGKAGPYPVRVTVRPPGVVPGLAEISVRVDGVSSVEVLPAHHSTGLEGAPPADKAPRVDGTTNLYSAALWLMESGTYSVHVRLKGDRGPGEAVIPVESLATKRLPMPKILGTILALLGVGLFFGLAGIVTSAVRESTKGVADPISDPDRRRGRRAYGVTCLIVTTLLYGGWIWWQKEDAQYRNNRMFKSLEVPSRVVAEEDGNRLRLELRGRSFSSMGEIVPDHGKMAHLFLVRAGDASAMAHLHPRLAAENPKTFESTLPPLPAGRYHVYLEVTDAAGRSYTITSLAEIPSTTKTATGGDSDDSWMSEPAFVPAGTGNRFVARPEIQITWETLTPIRSNRDVDLTFRVNDQQDAPVRLEPLMGMAAHAVVRREDGSVFAHLHPVGTISMAAQKALSEKSGVEPAPLSHRHGQALSHRFSFPYAFPEPGKYRLWIQVKSSGRIGTGVFDLEVQP